MSRREITPEFYRAAFDQAVDAMIAVDGEGRLLAANEAATPLFRTPARDLFRREGADFLLSMEGEASEIWSELLSGAQTQREVRVVRPDGQAAYLEITAKGAVSPGVFLAILRDLTPVKERELSSRRYELLREHAHDILLFIDREGRIVEANRAAETSYGYSREELLHLTIKDLRHESTIEQFDPSFRHAFADGIVMETMHCRRDGTSFPVEVSSRPARIGKDVVLLSVIRDVTDRRELHAKLLETDRLATFGMMAAGIAHEINNPLAYVLANAEVLARTLPKLGARARDAAEGNTVIASVVNELGECESMLRVATEGLERVRAIIRDLKTFSRADPEDGVLVDLHHVLDSALNIAQSELRHRARIVRSYGEIPAVRGSTSRLGQVFLNVIVNGAQAVPADRRGEGEVRIRTTTTADGWAVISVTDNGVGIPSSQRDNLFQPFHTTKKGEGTGLGLYISRTIVEGHGGRIDVESVEGEGTTVRVHLPPYDPTRKITPLQNLLRPKGRLKVLVVDDEASIGAAFRAVLAPTHDVALETKVSRAIEHLAQYDAYDAILCDVMMGDASGVDVLDHLRQRSPALAARMVFMTGGVLDAGTRERITQSGLPCLDKPLSRDELIGAIERASRRSPSW